MLRLNLSNKERWLDLGHGVKVKVLPMTTPLMLNAQGTRAVTSGDVTETAADATVGFAVAVAKLAITDWSGVGDADGKAIAVTPAGIDALLQVFPIFTAFQRQYISPGISLVAEKNGSAPSLNGTTAGARRTAGNAKAPAKNAPRAKTRPQR